MQCIARYGAQSPRILYFFAPITSQIKGLKAGKDTLADQNGAERTKTDGSG